MYYIYNACRMCIYINLSTWSQCTVNARSYEEVKSSLEHIPEKTEKVQSAFAFSKWIKKHCCWINVVRCSYFMVFQKSGKWRRMDLAQPTTGSGKSRLRVDLLELTSRCQAAECVNQFSAETAQGVWPNLAKRAMAVISSAKPQVMATASAWSTW